DEGDGRAFRRRDDFIPEGAADDEIAQRQLFRRSVDSLNPCADGTAVITDDEDRFAVWHPLRTEEIAVERARNAARRAAGGWRDVDLIFPAELTASISRIPERDRLAVRREDRIVLELTRTREIAHGACRDVQQLHVRGVESPTFGRDDIRKCNRLSVG